MYCRRNAHYTACLSRYIRRALGGYLLDSCRACQLIHREHGRQAGRQAGRSMSRRLVVVYLGRIVGGIVVAASLAGQRALAL